MDDQLVYAAYLKWSFRYPKEILTLIMEAIINKLLFIYRISTDWPNLQSKLASEV